MAQTETTDTWRVVVNDEEQYSVWPEGRDNPPGWRDEGYVGPRAGCLEHIGSVWTDMRPLSLRRAMGEAAR
ncbi:MbtH family NRPS accessory protein [Micromonospora sp. NPDC047074]|uniref:MbtH family protein n=1 Tax=Micromonospora sp. NPDC047074 TaxID=3154339 RepID=UPI0034089EC8